MADGVTITLRNDSISYYGDEQDFLHSITFAFKSDYSFLSPHNGPYLPGNKYSIDGYDDRFIGLWERVKFGDWIRNYGLIPNKTYYCSTIKYVVYLPNLSYESEYLPVLPLNDMGYIPWRKKRMFEIEYGKHFPKCIFYTGTKYIGYDENRKGIYKELPTINKLVWKFTVI